jgi:LuxR family transcriptional regulator, maltose regulon positive regulatory protein
MEAETGGSPPTPAPAVEHLPGPGFELLESKLEPPAGRPGAVSRGRLIDQLMSSPTVPVIAVVAPPGYGKTTVLAQWAKERGPRVAWLSCDDHDNDPIVLLTYLAAALRRVTPAGRVGFRVPPSAPSITVVPRLIAAVGPVTAPVSVVIDHAEAVTNVECEKAIAEFAMRLPPGWQLAIASRSTVPLPVGRLRAHRELLEVGVADLAMDSSEALSLMTGAGVDLTPRQLHELVQRTEGWPAGLYLAALSIKAGTAHRDAGFGVARDETYMARYVRSELLERASAAEVSFLTRTATLDRMCGPLCDAVLGVSGSSAMLEQLTNRDLFVIPLDRRHEWFRYHHLLRRLLLAELIRREPESIKILHTRAAEWFEAQHMPEAAIDHAMAAGDADWVARLVLDAAQPAWASGRVDTVLGWMEWLHEHGAVQRYPAIAVHGALTLALLGRAAEAEWWMGQAGSGTPAGRLSDGNTTAGVLAYLRAILCRDGVGRMRRDAQEGYRELSPNSPYRATMLYTEGISYLLEDDLDRADPILANAFDDAVRVGAVPLAALILAERCIVAQGYDDWPAAVTLTQQAVSIVEEGQFQDYWTSALVYGWAALVALRQGDLPQARSHLARAARLRPLLTYVLPVVSTQALLQMARVYIGFGDRGGAQAVLRQADEIRARRRNLGNLWAEADRLQASLDRLAEANLGATSLTAAELRLLPLLSTHLTLGEIGEQLRVSRHTVKAQTASIYRKLGVSSRGAAVTLTRELGI